MEFSANSYDNDIAILKIKSANKRGIQYGTHVQPACLPNRDTPHKPGTTCIVSGWGKTEGNHATIYRSNRRVITVFYFLFLFFVK